MAQTAPQSVGIVSGEGTFAGIPCSTLYVQNLNEKAPLSLLQRELLYVFHPYGTVLDIKMKKNLKMKGQAFVAFDTVEAASKALVALQGNIILHKPLVIKFARFKSYISSIRDGTYEAEREKQEADKTSRLASKKPKLATASHGADLGLPNKILFVQNIPALEDAEEQLNSLFSAHLGFKEVRLVPSKTDIAFVEYENDVFANAARLALDKFQILPGHEIRVSFSKK